MSLEHNKLAAARELHRAVSADYISLNKTPALLGESLDLAGLETETDDEDITTRDEKSAEQMRLLRHHMFAEARSFRDLECLIEALDYLDICSNSIHAMERFVERFCFEVDLLTYYTVVVPTRRT